MNADELKALALDYIRCGIAANYTGERRDELMLQVYDPTAAIFDELEAVKAERDALRARIEAAEKQEPYGYLIDFDGQEIFTDCLSIASELGNFISLYAHPPMPAPTAAIEPFIWGLMIFWAWMLPNGKLASSLFGSRYEAIDKCGQLVMGKPVALHLDPRDAVSPMPAQQNEMTAPELINSSPEFILKVASDICAAYSRIEIGNGGIKPELACSVSKILLTMLPQNQEPDSWRVTAKRFCGTHTTDKEVAEEWLKTGDAYPLYAMPPMPAQQLLMADRNLMRNLVDRVWMHVTESENVPSTKTADELIDGLLGEYKPMPAQSTDFESGNGE